MKVRSAAIAARSSVEWATFVNGLLIRYLDYNDTYLSLEPAHPSDNLAAVLAVGEAVRASGPEMIVAAVLAYEIQCRLCDASSLRKNGFDHVTYGAISSALAACKLMKLDVTKTTHAVGLAGVCNTALRQTRSGELSMWKGCAFANAARNAVFAAQLAADGMTGPAPIFEGDLGFMKLLTGPFTVAPLGGGKQPFISSSAWAGSPSSAAARRPPRTSRRSSSSRTSTPSSASTSSACVAWA